MRTSARHLAFVATPPPGPARAERAPGLHLLAPSSPPLPLQGGRHSTVRSRPSAKMPQVHKNKIEKKNKTKREKPNQNHNRNSLQAARCPAQTSPICSVPRGLPAEPCCWGGPPAPLQSVIFDTTWILFLLGLPGAPSSPSCPRAGVQRAHVQHQHRAGRGLAVTGRLGVGDPD